jgi:hypothetical protein
MWSERMSRDIEELLRSGLRPVEPGEAFTRQVMARVERERAAHGTGRAQARPRARMFRWASAALAASAVIAVVIFHQVEERRERVEGLAAREQLLEALRVTSEKLDLAYRGVQAPSGENDEDTHDS